MKALEVSVNGRRVCTAGVAEASLVTVIANLNGPYPGGAPEDGMLAVNGMKADDHVEWMTAGLGLGDEVTIRVVEVEAEDPPKNLGRRPDYAGS
jgi:hypothetical protein